MKGVRTVEGISCFRRRNFLFFVEGTFLLFFSNNLTGILEEIKHLRDKSKTASNSTTLLLSDPSLLLESREYLCTFKAFQATNVVGMVVCWRFLDFVEGFLFLVEGFLFLVGGLLRKQSNIYHP